MRHRIITDNTDFDFETGIEQYEHNPAPQTNQSPESQTAPESIPHIPQNPVPEPSTQNQRKPVAQPWTEEQEALLVRRFQEGATVSELSREFQRTDRAIRHRLRQLGCQLPVPEFISRAQSFHPNSFKTWSEADRKRLREMYSAREKIHDISLALGRSVSAIALELEKQDL